MVIPFHTCSKRVLVVHVRSDPIRLTIDLLTHWVSAHGTTGLWTLCPLVQYARFMHQCSIGHCDATGITRDWGRNEYGHDPVGHSKFLVAGCGGNVRHSVLYGGHFRDIRQGCQTMEIVCRLYGGYWNHLGSHGCAVTENLLCTHVVCGQYVQGRVWCCRGGHIGIDRLVLVLKSQRRQRCGPRER